MKSEASPRKIPSPTPAELEEFAQAEAARDAERRANWSPEHREMMEDFRKKVDEYFESGQGNKDWSYKKPFVDTESQS